jgi:hypothetical protein
MSQCLILNNVCVYRVLKDNIDEQIAECDRYIASLHTEIMMFAASSPRLVEDRDGYPMDWIEYCTQRVTVLLDELDETSSRRQMLMVAKYTDEKDVEESY